MSESVLHETLVRAHDAASLAKALGLAESVLGDALLTHVDRSEALFSLKDLATGRYVHVNARMAAKVPVRSTATRRSI